MRTIAPPDSHCFSAAVGWLELGNAAEAKVELARVSPELQDHPEVLEVAWSVESQLGDWVRALAAARRLVAVEPGRAWGWLHAAYALRRVAGGGLEAAWEALRPAYDKFPKEPVIPFNLACYACQMAKLDEAREWFRKAVAVGGRERMTRMALADEDLEPLWEEIRNG